METNECPTFRRISKEIFFLAVVVHKKNKNTETTTQLKCLGRQGAAVAKQAFQNRQKKKLACTPTNGRPLQKNTDTRSWGHWRPPFRPVFAGVFAFYAPVSLRTKKRNVTREWRRMSAPRFTGFSRKYIFCAEVVHKKTRTQQPPPSCSA